MKRMLVAVAATLLALGLAASAGARPSETFTFSDPFDGSFNCGTFTATISGHDHGHVKTWFDTSGNPIKEEGHIESFETDTNMSTGESIDVKTHLNVHMDFVAGTIALSGARNIANVPGQGVVVQHVGHVVIGPDGDPISLSGKYPEFIAGYMNDDFCAAIA